MNPILPVHHRSHNMPPQQPFFRKTFAENKFQVLQNAGKNKAQETSNMCNQQVKFLHQSKLNASTEDNTNNIQVRPLRSMRSRINNIQEKSPNIREKRQKKLPGTLRMTLEEKKLISQNPFMPKFSSNKNDECLFLCPKGR